MLTNKDADRHPRAEDLAAFARGRLPPTGAAEFERHVAECLECRRIVLDCRGLDDPNDPDFDGAWEALSSRLDFQPESTAGGASAILTPGRPWRRWAAAAAVLLVSIGVGWAIVQATGRARNAEAQLERLQREVAELKRPHVGVVEIDLFPSGMLRSGDPEPELSIPAASQLVILRLLPVDARQTGPGRLEIEDGEGRVVAILEDVQPDPFGKYVLAMPRELLPAGEVRLRLAPTATESTAKEYALRVIYE